MPMATCFHQFDNLQVLAQNMCLRNGSDPGVCCPNLGLEREFLLKSGILISFKLFQLGYFEFSASIRIPSVRHTILTKDYQDQKLLKIAIDLAVIEVDKQLNDEKNIIKKGLNL